MKKNGITFKYVAKVCSDGRLYNGGWVNADYVPSADTPGVVVLNDFPTDNTAKYGGSDYRWDGEKLIYDPVPTEEREQREKAIFLAKSGKSPEEIAALYGGDA